MNADGFLLLVSLIGVLFLGYLGIRRFQDRQAARTWPTTAGSVTATKIELQERGEQSVHLATVSYSYVVREELHTGMCQRSFLLYGRAEKWIARFPAGTPLVIRYNPGYPVESMLFEHEQPDVQA